MPFFERVYGLYGSNWKDRATKEASLHPAKYSKKLIYWVVQHGIDKGYWKSGDKILDPFAGVGLGAIPCADNDIHWVGVELEPRFVKIAEETFAKNGELWKKQPRIVQGDSKQLVALLGNSDAAITSPPYGNLVNNKDTSDSRREKVREKIARGDYHGVRPDVFTSEKNLGARGMNSNAYGDTSGQLGTLRSGDYDAALTSPPYGNRVDDHGADMPGIGMQTYGTETGQIGRVQAKVDKEESGTYWQSIREIYQQVYELLPTGGIFCVVVKDFARKKKVVPLCDMTRVLLESIGFDTIEVTAAMLVAEGTKPEDFSKITGKIKEYKSFPRREYEKKYPQARIDAEYVLWLRK